MEKTTVTLIGFDTMATLCEKHHCVETFFRKLVSVAVVKMNKRIGEMLEDNATEHYRQFVAENDAILQRISLTNWTPSSFYPMVKKDRPPAFSFV